MLRERESNPRCSAYETELVPSPVDPAILSYPNRIRTYTNRAKICCATVTLWGNVFVTPVGLEPTPQGLKILCSTY